MEKTTRYPNEVFAEDVDRLSQRSSLTYDEANDLTLTPYNNNNSNSLAHQTSNLEKVSTVKTEKYDPETGGLAVLETHKTSK